MKTEYAVIAQSAEHFLGKEEVRSSNLRNSSIKKARKHCVCGLLLVCPAWVRARR